MRAKLHLFAMAFAGTAGSSDWFSTDCVLTRLVETARWSGARTSAVAFASPLQGCLTEKSAGANVTEERTTVSIQRSLSSGNEGSFGEFLGLEAGTAACVYSTSLDQLVSPIVLRDSLLKLVAKHEKPRQAGWLTQAGSSTYTLSSTGSNCRIDLTLDTSKVLAHRVRLSMACRFLPDTSRAASDPCSMQGLTAPGEASKPRK